MSETFQFGLPLVAAGQAQKHVTVNESLAILDAVSQLRVESMTTTTPPLLPQDGLCYVIAVGATGDWANREGQLAVAVNSGWRYLAPKAGWQAYNAETGTSQLFDGTDWLDCTLAASPSGAAIEYKVIEIDHTISEGATSVTIPVIEDKSQVIGVTGRVTEAFTGSLTSWRLGVADSTNRYGSSLGMSVNSYVNGLTGTPVSYYAPTELVLTAEDGTFAGGRISLAVHALRLQPPRPV